MVLAVTWPQRFHERGDVVIVADMNEVGIRALTATWDAARIGVAKLDALTLNRVEVISPEGGSWVRPATCSPS